LKINLHIIYTRYTPNNATHGAAHKTVSLFSTVSAHVVLALQHNVIADDNVSMKVSKFRAKETQKQTAYERG
jgi:hypothetical protein